MKKRGIAKRYARIIMDVAIEENKRGETGDELNILASLLTGIPEVKKFLLNPMYRLEDRIGIVEELSKRLELSSNIQRFFSILVEYRHINLIPDIVAFYSKMDDEIEGRARVTVEAPIELDSNTIVKIKEGLNKLIGKKIILSTITNKELIGGIIIRIGNRIYDNSIRTHLENMKEKIIEGVVQ